jgi:hypothetical protein
MRQSKLGEKNHNYGKPRTDEAKRNISNAKAGEKHHFHGKNFTDEHKLKCARAHRKNSDDINFPMYLVRVNPRADKYCHGGFAVMNHPCANNRYFTSKTLSTEKKYELASEYLKNANEQLGSQTK